MWKVFTNTTFNISDAIKEVSKWKSFVYDYENVKFKKYFAEKVSLHFDNGMLFKKSEGIHDNFLSALSLAEKEIENSELLFPDVKCFLITENSNNVLVTLNLGKERMISPTNYSFILENDNPTPNLQKIKQLQHNSWETLIFSTEISDFYNGWINYTPSIEKRAEALVEYLLINKQLTAKEMSMVEKIYIENNIKNHHQYKDLYDRIIKIMPKIETSLEEEWREIINSGEVPKINIKKKGKI